MAEVVDVEEREERATEILEEKGDGDWWRMYTRRAGEQSNVGIGRQEGRLVEGADVWGREERGLERLQEGKDDKWEGKERWIGRKEERRF